MTWSKFDDAAPKNPKAVIAGNEAWSLWAAAVMYCNRHLTDGYVSLAALATDCLPVPIALSKAKRLADALCAAVARENGKGLFEEDRNGMYRVHDFLDWNDSKAEVEQRRKKDRLRKKNPDGIQTESKRSVQRNPSGVQPDSETPRASPSLSIPIHTKPDEESARAHPDDQGTWDGSERETACPLDLRARAAALCIPLQLSEALHVPLEAVEHSVHEFVSYWTIGAGMGQKRRHWMRKLREHVRKSSGKPGGLAAPGALEHARLKGSSEHEARELDRDSARMAEARRLYAIGEEAAKRAANTRAGSVGVNAPADASLPPPRVSNPHARRVANGQ